MVHDVNLVRLVAKVQNTKPEFVSALSNEYWKAKGEMVHCGDGKNIGSLLGCTDTGVELGEGPSMIAATPVRECDV